MYITTKGRYALRVMLDLAENCNGDYISKTEIAARQDISIKYLERILAILSRHGLIESAIGRNGGYRLAASPSVVTTGEILRITEPTLAPVKCLQKKQCKRSAECLALPLWKKFEQIAISFFNSVTLADLLNPVPEHLNRFSIVLAGQDENAENPGSQ